MHSDILGSIISKNKYLYLIAIALMLDCALFGQETYYVSSSIGNDSFDGLSPSWDGIHGPWRTISKVNSHSFNQGDSILLKKGDTWYEQLTIPSSGTPSTPIIFSAYDSGNKPIINGADTTSGWALYDAGYNIWVDTLDAGITDVTQVFVDGERYTLARWPNTGWNTIDSTSSSGTYLYDKSLTQADDYWVGCMAVWRYQWTFATATINASSSSSKMINFNTTGYIPTKNFGYYIEGKFEQLDNTGEFYFDASKHLLYVALPSGENPSNHSIEASNRNFGIIATSKDYITISGINIKNTALYGIFTNECSDIKIQDCNIAFSKSQGIKCNSTSDTDLKIENNEIAEVDGGSGIAFGIYVSGISYTNILNNTIHDISSDTVSPKRGIGIFLEKGVNNATVSGNTVFNVSNNGIMLTRYSGPKIILSKNTIYNCVLLLSDAGAIYMNGDKTGTVVEYNYIYDCPSGNNGCPSGYNYDSSVGIYFDETDSHGASIRYNIVSGCSMGIHLHKSYNTKVLNNTFYNNQMIAISLSEKSQNQMYNIVVKNNICYDTSSSLYTLYIRRYSTSLNSIGTFDHNLYYIPDKANSIKYYDGSTYYSYTLANWQSKTGLDSGNDANSLATNPLMKDVSNRDFHLTSSSPCIDAGTFIGLDEDFEGNSVPIGDDPDIGAFESDFFESGTGILKEQNSNDFDVYPNPSRGMITIAYLLGKQDDIKFKLYDIKGNIVDALLGKSFQPGTYTRVWDAKYQKPGIYIICMETSKGTSTRKILLFK